MMPLRRPLKKNDRKSYGALTVVSERVVDRRSGELFLARGHDDESPAALSAVTERCH